MSYSSWACKELDVPEATEHAHRVITVGGLFSLHLGFLVLFYLFFKKQLYLFCLCWVFSVACNSVAVVESGGYSPVVVYGVLQVSAVVAHGPSIGGSQALGHRLNGRGI